MSVETVGVISPGEMGAGVGSVLVAGGLDVVTSLAGRSELTRTRAAEAGMRDAGSVDDVVGGCDVLLSVLVPSEAVPIAEEIAGAMARTGARPVYAECNAIAPQTVERIGTLIRDVGATFVDAGIIGSPPRPGRAGARVYCSGPDTAAFEALGEHGLDIRQVGPNIGQASGLKMVYATSTKGTAAVWTELLVAARALDLSDALMAELGFGSTAVADSIIGGLTDMPRRSRRWVGEMEEIAATFEYLGLTPKIMEGAADMYRLVGGTPLGELTTRDPRPDLDAMLDTLAERLAERD
jgi:3-hydroxyisobutyrate dehydrogenase-like beta-hydroxyacid dehydrogenase